MAASTNNNFQWTDEEIGLLLAIVTDYKSVKAAEGLDWETVKNRYEDIAKNYVGRYPKNDLQAYPQGGQDVLKTFTKDRVQSKIKKIKAGYRKAVDTGRKSGGGRLVASFYDKYCEIWAGSPAVQSITGGIETSTASPSSPSIDLDSSRDLEPEEENTDGVDAEITDDSGEKQAESSHKASGRKARRQLFEKAIREKKDSKLTKRLSTDNQMLTIARDELQLKRKVIEQMEGTDKKHQKTMENLLQGVNTLTSALNNGFNLLC